MAEMTGNVTPWSEISMKNYQWLDECLQIQPSTVKEFQPAWQAYKYLIGGKMYAYIGTDDRNGRPVVTLKLEPVFSDMLRSKYEDIVPGYYMNKLHWSTVYLDGNVPQDVLADIVYASYKLVRSSLSKKAQQSILEKVIQTKNESGGNIMESSNNMRLSIAVLDKERNQKAFSAGDAQAFKTAPAVLAWEGTYEEGDSIRFTLPEKNAYYILRVDDTMEESLIYSAEQEIVYKIPFHEKKTSFNPKAFTGERHYLTVRRAAESEITAYRNLARNAADQHEGGGYYPHASANVETRGEAVFAARNAIDGVVANLCHGNWPYASWGINQQADAEFKLDFGRPVDFDRIVLYTRADFPHDNWWEQVTFSFSDGSSETVKLEKSVEPHDIQIIKKGITWLTFGTLIKADDPSPFPALTQIEVYGREG